MTDRLMFLQFLFPHAGDVFQGAYNETDPIPQHFPHGGNLCRSPPLKPSPAFRETVFGEHSGLIAHNLLQDRQRTVELSVRNGQRIKEADHVAVLAADQ